MLQSARLLGPIVTLIALSACGVLTRVGEGPVREALTVVDAGIRTIDENSAQWQTALRQVSDQLPSELNATLRNEAATLAQRSIAGTGEEIRCNVDFVSRRAREALVGLRNAILSKSRPAPLPPMFCTVAPSQVEVGLDPARWPVVTFSGYDLDHRDPEGNLLRVVLVDRDGATTPIDEGLVNRNTHYRVTVNLGDAALRCRLIDPRTQKLAIMFGDRVMGPLYGQGEVAVIPWTAAERSVVANLGRTSHMPPHTRGDRDFDTDDNDPMEVSMRGELEVRDTDVRSRVFLRAHEPRPDRTTAEGWSDYATAFQAPPGFRIVSVTPNGSSAHSANITEHGPHTYGRPGGEPVSAFQVWGDRGGDDAGVWTRVQVDWRNVDIRLRETRPPHLECPGS